MSILLDALKQKNKQSQDALSLSDKSASPFTLELPKPKADEGAVDTLESVVEQLAIKPPAALEWQLTVVPPMPSDPLPTEHVTEPNVPAPTGLSVPFDLVLPHKSTEASITNEPIAEPMVAPIANVAEHLALKTEMPVLSTSMDRDVETSPVAVHRAVVDDVVKPTETVQMSTELDVDTTSPESNTANPVVPAATDVPAANNNVTERITKEPLRPFVNKVDAEQTPLAAQRYLGFNVGSDKLAEQFPLKPNAYKSNHLHLKNKLLLISGVAASLGVLGFAIMSIWDSQQASVSQQLAKYQSLHLNDLPTPSLAANQTMPLSDAIDSLAPSGPTMPVDAPVKQSETSAAVVSKRATTEPVVAPSAHPNVLPESATSQSSRGERQLANLTKPLDTSQTQIHRRQPAVEMRPVDDTALKISQSLAVSDELLKAWKHWQQGDIASAEAIYRRILTVQPNQKDALMGMLAIAQLKQGTGEVLVPQTERLLRLYPHDEDVRRAVAAALGDETRLPSESQLKMTPADGVHQQENAFNLGLLYVSQQRWPEAQKAFFNAVSADITNPEYRANLAISYDQLGKLSLALESYQQALILAKRRPSTLDVGAIKQRIDFLVRAQESRAEAADHE